MAVVRLHDTQQAFDAVASTYDRSNAENTLLCAMRRRSRAALADVVQPGSHLLDLGCGPGTDVLYFAAMGYRVVAIDWSTAMVDEARRRVRASDLNHRVRLFHLGIDQLDRLDAAVTDRFDAVYSNFGPLNCVVNLPHAATAIANRLRSGGFLVASVIGRFCPWELAVYLLRGNVKRAFVRFASRPVPVPLEGRTVWTQYYRPAAFAKIFKTAGFRVVSRRALGMTTPPPYLNAFADRHRKVVGALQHIEDFAGDWPGLRACGDHFLIVLQKV